MLPDVGLPTKIFHIRYHLAIPVWEQTGIAVILGGLP